MSSRPLADFLREVQAEPGYAGQLAHLDWRQGRPGAWEELNLPLAPEVGELLRVLGLDRLYRHQVQALESLLAGRNVVIAAGTAAGKTLCYLTPIVQALAERRTARALLVYPTKALAQDQLRKLADFGAGRWFTADTYDGDTPPARRREIRRSAQVILTNPDMLHVGMLPNHAPWGELWANLRYVVLDEVHVYRGVFGSHVADLLRRLRRVCAHYGSRPQFVGSSATIANPGELCERLTGLPFEVVDQDTAPQGPRLFAFWNPPVLQAGSGRRRSGNQEAAELLARLVRRGVRTVVFTLSRLQAELVLRYARERLADSPELQARLEPYRGGYLPQQRREIERRLFAGELLGVVSTSALELGVDVGGLDAVIIAGYPGSLASVQQQAGRAGRGGQESLAVLVALGGGIDQYLMQHPEYLLRGAQEQARCQPQNRFILGAHLLCAAYELPLEEADEQYFGAQMAPVAEVLTEAGLLERRRRWYWPHPQRYPAAEVSLRSGAGPGFEIVTAAEGRLLGTVDETSAPWLVHPGAVYLHAGESYLVEQLDLVGRRAVVRPASPKYFTRSVTHSELSVLEQLDARPLRAGAGAHLGEVAVRTQTVGYRRLRLITEQELDTQPLDLPAREFESVGLWITLGEQERELAERGHDLMGSLHALEHALIGLLPLFVMCDPHDVGGVSYLAPADTGRPTVLAYDGHPGGVGLCEGAYENLEAVLQATAERIAKCICAEGCPACVQSPSCGNNNQPLDKAGAAHLAQALLTAVAD